MAYARRYVGGFVDKPTLTTPIDSTFLNAVEAALLKLYALDPADAQLMSWVAANSRFEPTLIKNANIDPTAAIAKSKLAPLSITDADVAGAAAIAQSKLALAITNAQIDPAAAISASKLAGYPTDALKALRGDGSWAATPYGTSSKITIQSIATGPPASPVSGDIWIATGVGSINGIPKTWMFVYDSTQPTYKWLFIGGAEQHASASGNFQNSANSVWQSTGLGVTVARAGHYQAKTTGILETTNPGQQIYIGVGNNGPGGIFNNYMFHIDNGSGADYKTFALQVDTTVTNSAVSAGAALVVCMQSNPFSNFNLQQWDIAVEPIAII